MEGPIYGTSGEETISGDAPQTFLPNDMEAWKNQLLRSVKDYGEVSISVSSTSSPHTVAISIGGHDEVGFGVDQSLQDQVLTFNVDRNTLIELQAMIGVAIASVK